ncbi:baseplate J/gp47 family protein [Marinomonas transparens]|uniref:Baseplate J/gp47 family protein n=1 Tax=Marinomonas transparens TaxID=2795388 RepID=A0A934N0X2_9GAMM|nr:baseplate J/gp47 family protein [Marinomonas transparens]MBJ7537157.1 baseplate J/gp47 family protein [Marinomonas transparens]
MAFSRPTRTTIQARVAADLERHSGQKATRRGDVYYPLAQALAGASHGLHGHLQYNADQLFDDSCDDQNLLRRAAELGIYQTRAYRASGSATMTGNDGAKVLAETLLQTDDEVKYRITEQASIDGGTATLKITAVEAGSAGNLKAGSKLRFISTQLDIDVEVTVVSLTGGSDMESIDRVRARLAERRKNPSMGGNKADYITWTLAAHSDITRAWCYPNEAGLGTVTVRFVTEDLDSPVPSATHIEAVENYVDEKRPVSMKRFYALPISPKPLDIQFVSLTPNTAVVQAAVKAELKDLLRRQAEPGGTLYLSQIREAVSLATGESNHVINLTEDATCLTGEFFVLGDITWSAD